MGHQLLTQLVTAGSPGRLHAADPGSEAPAEYPAVQASSSLADLPEALDLVPVAVPAAHAQAVIHEGGARGAASAVLFTSGFAEEGRVEEERTLADTARRLGVRLIGPNCAGIMDTRARLYASIEVRALPGRAAFITHSGTVGGVVLVRARTRGIGFSRFVSCGNRADIDEVELLDYLSGDAKTQLIAPYLESLRVGRALMSAVRRFAAEKPVLLIKTGSSSSGLRAAGSHTGSLAGSDRVFEAMVRQTGAFRVPGIEEMMDVCDGFASLPLLAGDRVAIVTTSGGPAILTSDRAEALGLNVAETSPALQSRLAEFLPGHCNLANLIDLTAEKTRDNH